MKWIAFSLLTCLCLVAASCGDPHENHAPTQATFAAQDGTAKEQLVADMKNEVDSSFRAEYRTTFRPAADADGLHPSATWYKDGIARQRFDFDGVHEFLYADTATVFTVGYKESIVVCSDEWPAAGASETAQAPSGTCCEDSGGCGDAAANLLYFLGFPLGFEAQDPVASTSDVVGGLDGVDATALTRRKIAGEEARCYQLTPTSPDEEDPNANAEMCFSATGVPLYWHTISERMGEVEVEATLVGTPHDSDFDYPYEVYRPTPESYVPHTPVPPIPMTVRLRFPSGATDTDIESALSVIRRRIATGPGCWSIPFKETDECITTERVGDEYVLRFDVSSTLSNVTDTEKIAEWLSARGQGRVRLRFCEAKQDASGAVATVAGGKAVKYEPDTCEPITNAQGQVQVTSQDGSAEWVAPDYVSIGGADLDNIVWSPAVGDLRGEPQPMTDAYLVPDASPFQPLTDNPDPDVGWRAIYEATEDGKEVIASITQRLAPKGRTLTDQRTGMQHGYPIAFFLDGKPVMGTDGHVAVFRVFLADFPPQLIDGLSRDTAYRVAQAINGPALQLPVDVVSVTEGP
jgi:hypothetical protein